MFIPGWLFGSDASGEYDFGCNCVTAVNRKYDG